MKEIFNRFIVILEMILLFILISIIILTLPIWIILFILVGLNIAEILVDSKIINKLL